MIKTGISKIICVAVKKWKELLIDLIVWFASGKALWEQYNLLEFIIPASNERKTFKQSLPAADSCRELLDWYKSNANQNTIITSLDSKSWRVLPRIRMLDHKVQKPGRCLPKQAYHLKNTKTRFELINDDLQYIFLVAAKRISSLNLNK